MEDASVQAHRDPGKAGREPRHVMLTGVLAGLAAGALWGLVFVAPRWSAGFSPVDLTAWRFMAYGVIAVAVMLLTVRGRPLPTWRQAAAAAVMSVLGFTGYYLLLALAIRDAGTEMPALIIGTIPIWVMVLGKPAGLRWKALVPGLLLTLSGLGLMMEVPGAGAAADMAGGLHYVHGIALALASLACWTVFALLNAAWLRRYPEVSATDWANWLGIATGLGGLGLWLVKGSAPTALASHPSFPGFVLLCFVLGAGSSWLATILWNIASQRLSASLCGQLIVSETLFALLYSFVWDGRWPTLAQWLATALFTLGIVASVQAHRSPA